MFIGLQRNWLNKMAQKGYRLVRTGKLEYEFEECEPGRYVYEIEYVGNKSFENATDYKAFLESLGYRVFFKNINLDWSVVKATANPFAEKGGRVQTTNTMYNRELLIVEKENDGKPFELHTTVSDKLHQLRQYRNAWLIFASVILVLAAFFPIRSLFIAGGILLIPALIGEIKILKTIRASRGMDAGGPIEEPLFIKIFIPVVLVLILAGAILGAKVKGLIPANSRSGSFIAYAETHVKGHFEVSIGRGKGKLVRTVSPKNNAKNVHAIVNCTGGSLEYTVKAQDGSTLFDSTVDGINGTFDIPTDGGKIVISITLDAFSGSLDFEYKN